MFNRTVIRYNKSLINYRPKEIIKYKSQPIIKYQPKEIINYKPKLDNQKNKLDNKENIKLELIETAGTIILLWGLFYTFYS
jgi:uncharacterized protein YccT (UPF0319 family)